MLTVKKLHIRLFALLLLFGGVVNEAWAAKVTYHILTLPIDNSIYHMKSEVSGKRLEAVKVVVDNQSTVELPAHFKSPLATDFIYYKPEDITGHGGSAVSLYDDFTSRKGVLYDVKASPTPVAEGTAINSSTAEYYVVYTYNASNTIAQLDGSVNYNIGVKGKGFLSLNRGRNNRPAVIPTAKVDPEMLASPDFSYVDNPGNSIGTYWSDGNNKNTRDSTESKFFFIFKFEGKDPYHIVVKTSYERNYTYIEQNDDKKGDFVYKWYKGAALFAKTTGNAYLASDDHIRYKTAYLGEGTVNPQDPDYDVKTGFYHGNDSYWGTVALLNNTSNTGYVFMGTRTVDGNGVVPGPKDNTKYYYLTFNGYNNLNFSQITSADATNKNTVDGIYPLKKVTFKIATPFYAADPSTDHIVSAPTEWVSQYTVDNDPIETKYLPDALKRKYCNFTGKFYSDAACTHEITHFYEADYDAPENPEDEYEGYQVYIGYEVTSDIPFKGITPAATYTASTWAGATWYELTDEASTQVDGLKLKYDGSNFKNNGADNHYDKTTEFAFIGDPYELRVVYRDATSDATPYYVGAAGTPPATGTLLTASTTASEGYKWELPADATTGSFLLRKYKGTGNWYWDAGHPEPVPIDYTAGSHAATYNVATANAQTVTFNVSNLTFDEGNYLEVAVRGTQATVQSEKIYVYKTGTATFKVSIQGRGGDDKQFILTIQEKKGSDKSNIGTAFVVTVNQNNSAIVANTVQYSTTNSTRVKVMTLPKRSFTYNIVDKSGRIAVKASTEQTIYSPLSLASIPSIIVSPFLVGETVTFYSTYPGGGRGNLSSPITELTAGDALGTTNIYVKYTTSALNGKPIKLSEDEEFNVKLNGHYIYYDATANDLKTKDSPTDVELKSNAYLWKLRNRDPYAMLIDNLGAREDLSVSGTEPVTVYNDAGVSVTADGVTPATLDPDTRPLRQMGAWLDLASIVNEGEFTFTTTRANAQQFIAKASLQNGVYEVMVADGGSVDASTTYYNIGCPEADVVKIYNNSTYAHGNDVLKFVLNQNVDYTYHLIDKAKHELLTATSKTPDLALPAEYQSPLVGTYNFYARNQITIDDKGTPSTADDEYTPKDPATKITDISDLNATHDAAESSSSSEYDGNKDASRKKTAIGEDDMLAQAKQLTETGYYYFNISNGTDYKKINVTRGYRGTDIYVTYDANDIVKFNTGQYMLKFLDPYVAGYYLEDGNDKLTATQIQAVYPYCNGDGNLNIYGSAMQNEQFNGGASTRPRWVWYFDSANSDPYHVRVRSRSTISYNSISNSTYLTTYAVHFNQDTEHPKKQNVVTGGTLPGVASDTPMEYMVLGSPGNYKLLTTNPVKADLNGDGDTDDTVEGVSENTRRYVTSFEQYWKTYNMVKLHVLGINNKNTDAYSEDASTWVVPNTPLATTHFASSRYQIYNNDHDPDLNYRDFLYQQMGWHSYETYANATRWNGYNDKSNGAGKKVVEKLEHWFQTFDMGNGTFDIESADVPPVLVLLDRHGWEIMRRPLPTTHYPEGEELAGLRVYDSPLVDRYYFYSNATKASGCHKYTLRLQNGAERDQVKVNGERYSSTSLGDLPPRSASGVVSGGAIQDLYVIYTVKEEYENNYAYNLDESTSPLYTETGISQPYLVLQNGRFYKSENTDNPNYISKPITEHTNPEGGNVYDLIVSPHNHGGNNHNIIYPSGEHAGEFYGNNFWYVKPNLDIDDEMGIPWMMVTGDTTVNAAKNKLRKDYKTKTGFDPYNIQLQLVNKNDGTTDGRYLTTHMTSAYLDNGIMVGVYALIATDADDVDAQAKKLRATGNHYFKQKDAEIYWLVNVTTAYNGSVDATYTKTEGSYATEWSNSQSSKLKLTLAAAASATVESGTSEGYDHTDMRITNQTFMAVSDANGNMQLMPRFDHTLRVNLEGTNPWETKLSAPVDHAKASVDNNSSMGPQTTFFVCPQRFHYHIIDNDGREALRYKRGADFYPTITTHFKSPFAKDFTYYKGLAVGEISDSNGEDWGDATGDFQRTLTKASMLADAVKLLPTAGTYYYRIGTRGVFSYKKVTVTEGLLDKQITGSFAAADVDGVDCDVYVRYDYDLDADLDADRMLQGQWYTVKLADKDLQADGKVMTFTSTVANQSAYETARDALTINGDYYFRIGTSSYTYKKVTVTTGPVRTEDTSDEAAWTNALGLGVELYAGEATSRSLTSASYDTGENSLDAQADKLTETGDYYFRVGTNPSYSYYKVTVTTAYDGSTDATHTDDLDDGSKGYDTYWSNSKPLVVDADTKKWQWKFFVAPADPTSDYYVKPDPYAIHLFNRYSNYTTNPSEEPSPMAIGIKVPNANNGADRFALLSHPSGGYALVVAKEYDSNCNYLFLNGENMTIPSTTAATVYLGNPQKIEVADLTAYNEATSALAMDGEYYYKYGNGDNPVTYTYKKIIRISGTNTETASTVEEWNNINTNRFTYKDNKLTVGTQLVLDNDVKHNYTYYVITNANELAITATQTAEEAANHGYNPYVPEVAQSPLLNMDDYKYYGFASRPPGKYSVIPQTILYTLSGLYDDNVYVRYNAYDMNKTSFKVPNKRNVTGTGQVARDASSVDASMNIDGGLPYNIVWYSDAIMQSTDDTNISSGGSHGLSGNKEFVWYFTGNDPYALKIKHKGGNYLDGTATMVAEGSAPTFMLLRKSGYDYGILQKTNGTDRLSGHGETTVTGDPTKYIIFGLSINKLIYHLIINTTNVHTEIPYRETEPGTEHAKTATWVATDTIWVRGTTQRDLTSVNTGEGPHYASEKYQLGSTLDWYDSAEERAIGHTYSYDAGSVSIGDTLMVPNIFFRPNCTFDFYVEGIYRHYAESSNPENGKPYADMNNKYKGLKLTKLMSDDQLIDQTVVVNIVYSFDKDVATNTGLGFVTDVGQNLWYTFETPDGATPYLAQYTNAWGLQAKEGRDTRYTNDYLWTPLGDVYGFRMYNRYMIKNSNGVKNVMTMSTISEGQNLLLAQPSTTQSPTDYPAGYEVFELLPGDMDGYFRVHPVVNTGATKYYVRRDPSDGYAKLSTTPGDWRYGLEMDLLEPYYIRAGYVGGLTDEGKTAYETEIAKDVKDFKITNLQSIVYNDDNIVHYTPGYYRLHSQPGVSGIAPVRYASGYLHKTELNPDNNDATNDTIPMHFYSKVGVTATFAGAESGLGTGFTVTPATRGEIPIDSTECDPSTIFYFDGTGTLDGNPRSTMQTQGLYVAANANGDADKGTTTSKLQRAVMSDKSTYAITFSLMDIGGAVLLIHDGSAPATRRYLNFDQSNAADKYDLKYYHESPTDDAKWCMQPVQKTATVGNGELSLEIETHNGGDGYYYATFYAPFDVLLPADVDGKTYNAYICKTWETTGVHPVAVPAATLNAGADNEVVCAEGKFVPAATPVILRVKDERDTLTLTLPTTSPSERISSCIFSGSYLEQLLDLDSSHDTYTFGLPFTSAASIDRSTGVVTAPLKESATTGVGFYINATPNKEFDPLRSNWQRNNRYVLHNRIYYRATSPGAKPRSDAPQFVPVIFDDSDIDNDDMEEQGRNERYDNHVYDLSGRMVATEQQVLDGSWTTFVAPGTYIVNGRKVRVK